MTPSSRRIAIFDFDGTLIKGDSLWPFLGYAVGWPQTLITMGESVTHNIVQRWKNPHHSSSGDSRTFIKTYLLENLLAGIPIEQLTPSLESLYRWQRWNAKIKQTLLDHHAKGDHIVIASGGLDLYLPHLLKDIPYNALICTKIEVVDGIITGHMPLGNCVRAQKAELVAEYITAHGPFDDSWGYGNAPHDVPMLNLLKHRILV